MVHWAIIGIHVLPVLHELIFYDNSARFEKQHREITTQSWSGICNISRVHTVFTTKPVLIICEKYTGSSTYDHPHLRPQKLNFFCDPILFAICTSKIINKLIINQAAARMITMGASGNTGLPHTQASSLSLSHTFSRFQASVACGVLIKILLKYYSSNV
jgi:hypothetical protein